MDDLKARTKRFALEIIRHCTGYPQRPEFQIITRQLMRAATSVGSNYRAACRAKPRADFICKLSTVEEEADESAYWLEMLNELDKKENAERHRLINEGYQLIAIMASSKKTARANAR
jgi:four helix bundle protein